MPSTVVPDGPTSNTAPNPTPGWAAPGPTPPSRQSTPRIGRRERNRRETMRRIQTAALDLFDAHGFDAATIEDVAAAAGVSPSTVYRYFRTKERLILHDELDDDALLTLGVLVRHHHLVHAMRTAVAELLDSEAGYGADSGPDLGRLLLSHRRMRYCLDVPSIRSAMAAEIHAVAGHLAAAMAASPFHAHQHPSERRALAVGVLWACATALEDWYDAGCAEPVTSAIDRALGVFRTPT